MQADILTEATYDSSTDGGGTGHLAGAVDPRAGNGAASADLAGGAGKDGVHHGVEITPDHGRKGARQPRPERAQPHLSPGHRSGADPEATGERTAGAGLRRLGAKTGHAGL